MGSLTPEGVVKRKVVEVLKRHAVWYFFPGNNGFGKSGIPDIIAVIDGHFVGIECKADRSKSPTALQVKCGADIQKSGGMWRLIRCDEDVAAFEKEMTELCWW